MNEFYAPWDTSTALQTIDADVDTFIFDCDGVIYRAGQLIDGASRILLRLREMKKRVLFFTNNSTISRLQIVDKLAKMGIESSKEEILSCSFGTAEYLNAHPDFDNAQHRVLVLGGIGIVTELAEVGIRSLSVDEVVGQRVIAEKELQELDYPEDIRAVVVGFDGAMTYGKCAYVQQFLNRGPDKVMFISTNQDPTFPAGDGCLLPGGGVVVAMVKTAALREPINIGKPETRILDAAVSAFNIDLSRSMVIGDRLDTDMLVGRRAGSKCLLVMTGATTPEMLAEAEQHNRGSLPHFVVPSIKGLLPPEEQ